jgi:hypothetical protein
MNAAIETRHMTSTVGGRPTNRSIQRCAVLLVALLTAMVGAFAVPGSPAYAAPIANTVTATAFIWNCPTGAPGCFPGAQTRVGDVRVNEPLTDVCTGNFGGNLKNLVWNRTTRVGAAERTGFLYRSFLRSASQTESCYTGGVFNFAEVGTIQRLCPYFACGRVGAVLNTSNPVLKDFCYVLSDGTEWRLIVTYDDRTRGPVTAGFIPLSELDPFVPQQRNCRLAG